MKKITTSIIFFLIIMFVGHVCAANNNSLRVLTSKYNNYEYERKLYSQSTYKDKKSENDRSLYSRSKNGLMPNSNEYDSNLYSNNRNYEYEPNGFKRAKEYIRSFKQERRQKLMLHK